MNTKFLAPHCRRIDHTKQSWGVFFSTSVVVQCEHSRRASRRALFFVCVKFCCDVCCMLSFLIVVVVIIVFFLPHIILSFLPLSKLNQAKVYLCIYYLEYALVYDFIFVFGFFLFDLYESSLICVLPFHCLRSGVFCIGCNSFTSHRYWVNWARRWRAIASREWEHVFFDSMSDLELSSCRPFAHILFA